MSAITLTELAENAVQFGHKTARWSPYMKPYLWGQKGGIHVFDLNQTAKQLEDLLKKIAELSEAGKTILFVSTKPQTKQILLELHEEKRHPIVVNKWVSGMLTNFDTIKQRIRRLKDIQEMRKTGDIEKFPKKEQSKIRKEEAKLSENFSGVIDMYKLPDAVFIIDGARDAIAVREAKRLKIPVYGICDSNVDPRNYTLLVPANDDAITSLTYLLGKVFGVLESLPEKKRV